MKKIGFTIGKFAPLHKGHQYLIETAIKEMDEVYCIVYDTDITNIPAEERANWIKRLYPNVNTILAFDSPQKYGLDEESVKIQMEYLSNIIKGIDVTHFYSSEPYGEKVAQYLDIENRVVDRYRIKFPISSTKIRKNFMENKKYMEDFVIKKLYKHRQKGDTYNLT